MENLRAPISHFLYVTVCFLYIKVLKTKTCTTENFLPGDLVNWILDKENGSSLLSSVTLSVPVTAYDVAYVGNQKPISMLLHISMEER